MYASEMDRRRSKCVIVLVLVFAIGLVYFTLDASKGSHRGGLFGLRSQGKPPEWSIPQEVPEEILSLYSATDFNNTDGMAPPFWQNNWLNNCSVESDDESHCVVPPSNTWGPCYPPSRSSTYNWTNLIQSRHDKPSRIEYHEIPRHPTLFSESSDPDLSGYCRPGFIIIGAGKCGTSSLYHYLIGHPRVLPANEKQIHYFKYHAFFTLKWYLAHFPSTKSFLSSGALVTGEASPGYMSYPNVAYLVKNRMPGPKIIAIGREPLDRSWSSYKYNYVIPAMEKLRKGRHKPAPKGESDEFYRKFLFSYEDMMRAELASLKECLAPGGVAETGARKSWLSKPWFKEEFDRREKEGLPPLVDLDKYCYAKGHSAKAPRRQWLSMAEKHPDKIINLPNLQLVQAFIGRSLYALPLEWWYATHGKSNVYFVCTEELEDETGEPLNELAHKYLGLPSYNFSQVVSEGMYNVGYNTGYDQATTWEVVDSHVDTHSNSSKFEDGIPISDELRKEFLEFVRPYNERLFQLTGKRCQW